MIVEEQNTITQDYLRAVWHLQQKEGIASNNALSKELKIANASVTEMLLRLTKQGLVKYTPYKGAVLSKKGRLIALDITRRHKLWEVFLSKKLGFSWEEVHELAHLFEHINSSKLIEKLDDYLGNPTHDPHGDLIPQDNEIPEHNVPKLLSSVTKKCEVKIRKVDDENPELLKHFADLGLSLNSKIKIVDFIKFDGSVKVQAKSNVVVISDKLAQCIYVTE